MIFLKESIWWMIAMGGIGLLIGAGKGLQRWGFVLGLIFGPIGWGIIMMLPARIKVVKSSPTGGTGGFKGGNGFSNRGFDVRDVAPAEGQCPRCAKPVARSVKACPNCGNVLMAIKYQVSESKG